ncbi:type II toxin-antitoxin system RelE/ParE family toxin [Treponema primitia]|uniref:type II toxin-antitoxin system RelE/ParE family toxin n=1 Tax=Treponema primitia TaxID=88058 RepID=UPI00025553E3|nr:type II toxin-antitoxin system RelE/ParE family toxin [Treponema primitia]
MRKIEWTPDGEDSFNEIIEYFYLRADENTARKIFNKINKEIELLQIDEIKTKVSPELKDIGINDIYQLTINPWIVYYKINEDNKKIKILLVLDGRRNIEKY